MTDKELAAYFAGFFDGEGSIGIYAYQRENNGGGRFGALSITIGQVDHRPLALMQDRYGGSFHSHTRSRGRPMTYLKLTGQKAASMLADLLPFLVVKRRQAELAIHFQSLMRAGKGGSFAPLTEAEKSERLQIIDQMKVLKHFGEFFA